MIQYLFKNTNRNRDDVFKKREGKTLEHMVITHNTHQQTIEYNKQGNGEKKEQQSTINKTSYILWSLISAMGGIFKLFCRLKTFSLFKMAHSFRR